MLDGMQQAGTSPSPNPHGFSRVLASLASPAADAADEDNGWRLGDLGDDVVTLSYERALRAHTRYKRSDGGGLTLPEDAGAEASDAEKRLPMAAAQTDDEIAARTNASQAANDRDLRSTSVTIRLSSAENARLRRRAAEAGLTVSAYLRSCAFEVEILRAQVKEALADLKTSAGTEGAAAPVRRPWLGWIGWMTKRK